jgi:hypothetical protein
MELTYIPLQGRLYTAPVLAKPCIYSAETGYVYLIGGADPTTTTTTLNSQFNITTSTWTSKSPLPTGRQEITPVQVKDKIYVIGGYTSGLTPTALVSIYDIATDTWSTGTNIPTAVGNYAIGVYGDSLIYVVGGYSGTTDVNSVQIYNVNSNSWVTGTSKIGTAGAGARMGISDNKIVFVGGYNKNTSTALDDAYLGTIDPESPETISWTAIDDYTAGAVGRLLAGGMTIQYDGRVYFGGGDSTGTGTHAMSAVFAYNVKTNHWEIGPHLTTKVSNTSGLAGIVENGNLYLLTMGGYDGTSALISHEWLKIGEAAPLPFAQADTTICAGASFSLDAYDGISYRWTPSTSLSDTTVSNPTASPASTTTYSVSIEKGYGCPVEEKVVVTVNQLPTVTLSDFSPVCATDAEFTLSGCSPSDGTFSGTGVNDGKFSASVAGIGTHTVTYAYKDNNGLCFKKDYRACAAGNYA